MAAALQIWSATFARAFDALPASIRTAVERKVDEMGAQLETFRTGASKVGRSSNYGWEITACSTNSTRSWAASISTTSVTAATSTNGAEPHPRGDGLRDALDPRQKR